MNKRNRVLVSVVSAGIIGAGVFCGNVFAENMAESEFSVSIAPSTTIVIPSSPINLVVEPTATGVFASGSFNIKAYTNNPDGYTVTMTTENTALTSNTVNISSGDFYTIPTLSASATESTFELNKWGISLNSGTSYIPMTTSSTILDEDEATPASGHTQRIGYATKLDFGTVPGTYSTTIGFAISAKIVEPDEWVNPVGPCHNGGAIGDDSGSQECPSGPYFPSNSLLRAFELAYIYNHKPIYVADDATNTSWHLLADGEQVGGGKQVRFAMQDVGMKFVENNVEYSVCGYAAASNMSNSYIDEALVMDLRDGKSYWIAKLEDGKCWMTQNLDHNISTTGTYNDINTDLGWNGSAYPSELVWDSTTQTYSNTPNVTWVPSSGTTSLSNFNTSEIYPRSVDTGDYYQVANLPASNTNTCDYVNSDCSAYFSTTRSNWADLHWHVGNYYNIPAAAAINDANTILDDDYPAGADFSKAAQTSVCPRGWRIAYAGFSGYDDNPATNFNDFYDLAKVYNKSSGGTPSWDTNQGFVTSPLYFVRAGYVRDYSTTLEAAASDVFYQSSLYFGSEDSSIFEAGPTFVSYGFASYYAPAPMPMRCIAR